MTPHRPVVRRVHALDGVKARVIAAAMVAIAAVVASCGVEGQGQVGAEPPNGPGPVATLLPSPQAAPPQTPNASLLDQTAALMASATANAIANPIPPYNPRDPNLDTPAPPPSDYVPGTPFPTVVRGLPGDPPADYFPAVMPTPILSNPSDPIPPPFLSGTPPFKPGDASWEQGRKIWDPHSDLARERWGYFEGRPANARVKIDDKTFAVLLPVTGPGLMGQWLGTFKVWAEHVPTSGLMPVTEAGVWTIGKANPLDRSGGESSPDRFARLVRTQAEMALVMSLFNDEAKAAAYATFLPEQIPARLRR